MAIVGSGDIASVLPKRDDLLFFASGVSNSQCSDEKEYKRETDLLLKQQVSRHIVYFSSLAIFSSTTRYAAHKQAMELLIKMTFPRYTIVRIGNITFGNNPHTIINFFKGQLKQGIKPKIQNTFRYIIDKEEFLYWISLIPDWNCEMNIPGRRIKVQQILDEIKQGLL